MRAFQLSAVLIFVAVSARKRAFRRLGARNTALAAANDTLFGLSAGICTTSLKFVTDFKRNSEAGMVMVNLPTAGVDYHVPFGGRKGSSYGPREQGSYAREFYTTVKQRICWPEDWCFQLSKRRPIKVPA